MILNIRSPKHQSKSHHRASKHLRSKSLPPDFNRVNSHCINNVLRMKYQKTRQSYSGQQEFIRCPPEEKTPFRSGCLTKPNILTAPGSRAANSMIRSQEIFTITVDINRGTVVCNNTNYR